MAEAGRDIADLEMIGGTQAVFPDDRSPADLGTALAASASSSSAGFTTFCVKPNQFIDDPDGIGDLLPGRHAARGEGDRVIRRTCRESPGFHRVRTPPPRKGSPRTPCQTDSSAPTMGQLVWPKTNSVPPRPRQVIRVDSQTAVATQTAA